MPGDGGVSGASGVICSSAKRLVSEVVRESSGSMLLRDVGTESRGDGQVCLVEMLSAQEMS